MADDMLRPVLRSDDLPPPAAAPGGPASLREQATAGTIVRPDIREVQVDGGVVLLTRLASGEVVAFQPYCPHQGAPLRNATIDRGNIRCEQHKFVYDPHTGRNVLPSLDASPRALERLKPGHLTTYAVDERDGWIRIAARPNPPPDEDQPLPASAIPSTPPAGPEAGDDPLPARPQDPVDVAAGEEFELDLLTRHRPNHLWHVEVEGEAVHLQGQRLEEQADGLHHRVRAVASTPGTARVHCTYAKPWGSDPSDTHTFTVRVSAP